MVRLFKSLTSKTNIAYARYIYVLFIAIDACFRLKRKLVSSVAKDPYLQPGMAYFVDPEPYRKFLLSVTDQDEV